MAIVLLLAALAAVCLGGAELAELAPERGALAGIPAFWPPTGLVVAALIVSDQRRWTWMLLAGIAATMTSLVALHGRPFVPSLAIAMVSALDALAVAWLFRRITASPFALDRLQHAFTLIACAAAVPLAGGVLAASALTAPESAPWLSVWRTWWLADAIGILLTAPLVVAAVAAGTAWRGVTRDVIGSWRALETILVFAMGLAATEAVFGGILGPDLRVPAIVLPFLLWPAFRFGPGHAAFTLFAVGSLTLWHASRGEGPAALVSETDVLLRAQAGVAIGGATLLLLASVVAERKRVAQERAALVTDLQQALAEIKTLRGFIPICAWCHKVRDDAGFWQRIEQYVDARTDATFSHGICPACVEHERRAIAAHQSSAEDSRQDQRPRPFA